MADGGNEDRGGMLVIFKEVAEGLKRLDADDRHRIMDAVLDWYTGGTGEVEGLSPTAALVAAMMRDKQMAYEAVCRKRRVAGALGGKAKRRKHLLRLATANPASMSTSTSESESDSKSKSKSDSEAHRGCVRPTYEEVAAYCGERGNKVDARAWYDYYTSNGWRVGKNPMKDWRAAVRTWERNGVGACKAKAAHGDNYIGATEEQRKEFSDGFGE